MSRIEKACQALGCAANELAEHNPKAAIAIAQTMVSLMRGELDSVQARNRAPARTQSPAPKPNKRKDAAPPARAAKPANRKKEAAPAPRARKAPPANRRKEAPPRWAIQLASSLERLGIPAGVS
jgi:hypothetical protein